MIITIDRVRNIDDEKQVVFFTLTNGVDSFEKDANTPVLSGAELQGWLDAKADFFWRTILHDQYAKAPASVKKSLQKLEAWIANDPDGKKAQGKKPWTAKHPPPGPEERLDTLDTRIDALELRIEALEP